MDSCGSRPRPLPHWKTCPGAPAPTPEPAALWKSNGRPLRGADRSSGVRVHSRSGHIPLRPGSRRGVPKRAARIRLDAAPRRLVRPPVGEPRDPRPPLPRPPSPASDGDPSAASRALRPEVAETARAVWAGLTGGPGPRAPRARMAPGTGVRRRTTLNPQGLPGPEPKDLFQTALGQESDAYTTVHLPGF